MSPMPECAFAATSLCRRSLLQSVLEIVRTLPFPRVSCERQRSGTIICVKYGDKEEGGSPIIQTGLNL